MPATPAAHHPPPPAPQAFDSTDPELTEAFLTAAYRTTIKLSCEREHYRFRFATLVTGPLGITSFDHTLTTRVRADPVPDSVVVVRMRRGSRTNVDLDDYLGPGDISVHAQPAQTAEVRLTSAAYTAVSISTQALADAAHNRPDDELGPLYFHTLRPAHPAAAAGWIRTVDYLTESLRAHPDAMTQPLLCGAATRLLAATLLTTFPNTWITEPHHHDRTDATATTLTRAIAFIETNPDIDISITDIARAAHVTVRAVQLAFRRGLDTTPMTYLRRVRLDRAHQQLRDADTHDGTTITQVAARWGFAAASRFTALYRQVYGQPPSQTLRN